MERWRAAIGPAEGTHDIEEFEFPDGLSYLHFLSGRDQGKREGLQPKILAQSTMIIGVEQRALASADLAAKGGAQAVCVLDEPKKHRSR